MVNVYLQRAILEVVENQIRDNNPPETRETFERLLRKGYSEEDAKKLIGTAVVYEVFNVLKKGEPYNGKRYIKALKNWDEMSNNNYRATDKMRSSSCFRPQ